MKRFLINGPNKGVKGEINISGAKNSCLPLMAASILFKKKVILRNAPFVKDVLTMKDLLISLGSKVELIKEKKIIKITNNKKHKLIVPYNLVSTMRAGVLTMGPLLARYPKSKIRVALGGGCALGIRDTSWHLSGFKSLGADNTLNGGYVNIYSKNGLKGSIFKFPKVTVTGSSNLIMASVLIKLEHIINELVNGDHTIIGDRIEALSYLCVAAITNGRIKVKKIDPKYLNAELRILKKIGYKIEINVNSIMISPGKKTKPVSIKTGPWPQFATDNMPIILAVLTKVSGKSVIEETIFSNRFMAVPELKRMGAKISIKKNKAFIIGQKKLNAADCISSDLRTTFSIILGAISAEGSSTISRIYHGLRGYENLQIKLKKLGIKIKLKK